MWDRDGFLNEAWLPHNLASSQSQTDRRCKTARKPNEYKASTANIMIILFKAKTLAILLTAAVVRGHTIRGRNLLSAPACGCDDCTADILQRDASGFSCADRIEYLVGIGQSEEEACGGIAGQSGEFPDTCGPQCDPARCGDFSSVPPTEEEVPTMSRCGCDSCDTSALGTLADGFTCESRINYLVNQGTTETNACAQVGGQEFPSVCGACDPSSCDGGGNELSYHCGCEGCDDTALAIQAGDFTCGERIDYLVNTGQSEEQACSAVAGDEFTNVCGPVCDPSRCAEFTPGPRCGCDECNNEVLNKAYPGGTTCSESIDSTMENLGYSEIEACRVITGSKSTYNICGPQCNPDRCGIAKDNPIGQRCGCPNCNANVLGNVADGKTCEERIDDLISTEDYTEAEACAYVSSVYSDICGPECDTVSCKLEGSPDPTVSPTPVPTVGRTPVTTVSPTAVPTVSSTESFRCGCAECTDSALTQDADGFTCGARIDWLMVNMNYTEPAACRRVAGDNYSDYCAPACDPDSCTRITRCGCSTCDEDALSARNKGGRTCGNEIDRFMEEEGLTEVEACREVGDGYIPYTVCAPDCDPDRCVV